MSTATDEQTSKAGTQVRLELGHTTETRRERHVVSHVQTEEDMSSDYLLEALAGLSLRCDPPTPSHLECPPHASRAHSALFYRNSVDLDPVRRPCSRRPATGFSRVLKLRSPISEMEANTTCFDEFFVSDRNRRKAIGSDGSGAQGRLHATTTRTLLSSDPNGSGRIVEEVIEVAARPRAVYNATMGCQIHLEMSALPRMSAVGPLPKETSLDI